MNEVLANILVAFEQLILAVTSCRGHVSREAGVKVASSIDLVTLWCESLRIVDVSG